MTSTAGPPICYRRETCRLCGSTSLEPVIRLAPTPPANAFVEAAARDTEQTLYPLDVMFCGSCTHVQLGHVVDPRALFERYVYVSGTSEVFVDHFRRYAQDVLERYDVPRDALVVDIGSNDGTLLRSFQSAGRRVLGVDPAIDIAREATASGVETVTDFFTRALAAEIRERRGRASVVTANNVMAHIDDLSGIVDGILELLEPDGTFVFEVSYLVDVYEKTLFDTIYHEHLDYHTVRPLDRFMSSRGLELVDVQRVSSHGGSIRAFARPGARRHEKTDAIRHLIAAEDRLGLQDPRTLRSFGARIDELKRELMDVLWPLRRRGERIAGFGAPAKATTLMHHFELGSEMIDFMVDDNPRKQGLFSPGLHVPVLPTSALYDRRPENVLVLAWNFAEPIVAKHRGFIGSGGRMIVPLPRLQVLEA